MGNLDNSELQIREDIEDNSKIIISPGQCPGRAIVRPPASVLALALAVTSALAKC